MFSETVILFQKIKDLNVNRRDVMVENLFRLGLDAMVDLHLRYLLFVPTLKMMNSFCPTFRPISLLRVVYF